MRRITIAGLALRCWPFVLASTLVASSVAWLSVEKSDASGLASAIRSGTLVAKLANVPSHNRRYRATLAPELSKAGEISAWQLHIEKSDRASLGEPVLAMQSWMPEDSTIVKDQPTTAYVGHGTFRVEGLRFGQSGWWNVKLTIREAGVADSLAFNLIVP